MQSKIIMGFLLGVCVATSCIASCLAACTSEIDGTAESYTCEAITDLKELDVIPKTAQRITIFNSKLPVLTEGAFSRFGNTLIYLNITHSKVAEIPSGAFSGLTKLCDLILDNNNIRSIKTDWIQDLTNLEELIIWRNYISYIEPTVFDKLTHLETLDIAHNQIDNCLEKESLLKLKSLKTLYVTDNPWPLRCRPEVLAHLEDEHIQVINTWGNSHILIAECLAHEPYAKYNDEILRECVQRLIKDQSAISSAVQQLQLSSPLLASAKSYRGLIFVNL